MGLDVYGGDDRSVRGPMTIHVCGCVRGSSDPSPTHRVSDELGLCLPL